MTGIAGRLDRAVRNFPETFPFFAAAVLVAQIVVRRNWMTVWGVQLYFWARALYVALYAFGVPLIRSLAWNAATIGIALILLALR